MIPGNYDLPKIWSYRFRGNGEAIYVPLLCLTLELWTRVDCARTDMPDGLFCRIMGDSTPECVRAILEDTWILSHTGQMVAAMIHRYLGPVSAEWLGTNPLKRKPDWMGFKIVPDQAGMTAHERLEIPGTIRAALMAAGAPQADVDRWLGDN